MMGFPAAAFSALLLLIGASYFTSFQTGIRTSHSNSDSRRLFFSSGFDATQWRHNAMQLSSSLEDWIDAIGSKKEDVRVTFKKSSDDQRTIAIAKSAMKENECMCSIPLNICLDAKMAETVFSKRITRAFLRTGELGLIALLLLHERSLGDASKYAAYISSLPSTPPGILSWDTPQLQELVRSTTRNVQSQLDAIDADVQLVVGSDKFPPEVYSEESVRWAMGVVKSRYVILESGLSLAPAVDAITFDPDAENEPRVGSAGIFGGKVVRVLSDRAYDIGDTVYMSYGLKSSAECLEDHGVIPDVDEQFCAAELSVSIDEGDRFFGDKESILEDNRLSLTQQFDLESASDVEIDPELLRFVRLKLIGGTDGFILESVFRNTVYETLQLPFSRANELQATEYLRDRCSEAVARIDLVRSDAEDREVLAKARASGGEEWNSIERKLSTLRIQERAALQETIRKLDDALTSIKGFDGREYYQERRLRELDLLRPLDDEEVFMPGDRPPLSEDY